jgi:hypothetical protein
MLVAAQQMPRKEERIGQQRRDDGAADDRCNQIVDEEMRAERAERRVGKTGFRRRPKPQRTEAPKAAPVAIATSLFDMKNPRADSSADRSPGIAGNTSPLVPLDTGETSRHHQPCGG